MEITRKKSNGKINRPCDTRKIKIIWRRKYQRAGRAEQIESST